MFVYYLTYLFLFSFVLNEKYKSVKAVEDDYYQKTTEAYCSGNFKLKAGYTAEEKRVWRFSVNKNCCIKNVINKINDEREKRIACTRYFVFMFLKDAQCITEVAARRYFVQRLLLKHFNWY